MNDKTSKDKAKLLLNAINGKNEIENNRQELRMYHEMAALYLKAASVDNMATKNAAIYGFMNMHGEMENLCEDLLSLVDEALEILTQCGSIFADLSNYCIDPNDEDDSEKE